MSVDIFCHNCGTSLEANTEFCNDCGEKQDPTKAFKKQADKQLDELMRDAQEKKLTYERPKGYIFTETISQRIISMFKGDKHVTKEIMERDELHNQSTNILIGLLSYLSIITIITGWLIRDEISNPVGFITGTIFSVFLNGILFVYLLAFLGIGLTGKGIIMDKPQLMRVFAYGHLIQVIPSTIILLDLFVSNVFFSLLWLAFFFYSIILPIIMLKRSLETNVFIGFIVFLTAFVLAIVGVSIALVLVSLIFDVLPF